MLNTQTRILQEMSYGLMRAFTGEEKNLKGLIKAYENWDKCKEACDRKRWIEGVSHPCIP